MFFTIMCIGTISVGVGSSLIGKTAKQTAGLLLYGLGIIYGSSAGVHYALEVVGSTM